MAIARSGGPNERADTGLANGLSDECHIIVDWNRCQIIVDLSLGTKLSLNILWGYAFDACSSFFT